MEKEYVVKELNKVRELMQDYVIAVEFTEEMDRHEAAREMFKVISELDHKDDALFKKQIRFLEKEVYFTFGASQKERYVELNKRVKKYSTFKVKKGTLLYVCSPSIKSSNFQLSYFRTVKKDEGNELMALGDKQCETIDDVIKFLCEEGLELSVLTDNYKYMQTA